MRIEAVIFDCDGTLVDSEVLTNTILVECAARFGLHMSVEEAMRRYVGGRMADCVADMENLLGHKLPDSFVPDFRERTAAAFRASLEPVEGARETLANLRLPCCVASNGPLEKIALSLDVTGLSPFFPGERTFSAYDVGFWKPDARLFLHAARAMGVAPGRCAVVEDSLPGVKAGIAAGMPTFWFRPPDDVPERVMRLANIKDLPGMLADLAAPKSG
ncbi:MAG TPA: HAD-IA family hydrolase [Rhodanobacteraceae bacterium]|nr:HAD-IA family hydrolase [Rhodanobacteraceae bacterium]